MRLFVGLLLIPSAIWAQPSAVNSLPVVNEANYASTVAANKGKVVLVNFWATWCVPCRKEMPALVKMAARLESKGFALVTISGDEAEAENEARKFLIANAVKPPTYIRKAKDDDKFITLVDAKWNGSLPTLFLYDRKGVKVKAWYGETSLDVVEAQITKLF